MHDLLERLSAGARVLDLGSGPGSFDPKATAASVIEVDVDQPPAEQENRNRVTATAAKLPLPSQSTDLVIANHTLEHFEGLHSVLQELDRVLRPGGAFWTSFPRATSLDDRLYRYLFEGGGHVNQLELRPLIEQVEATTDLRAVDFKALYTGFVYLNPPAPEKAIHYPERAKILTTARPGRLRFGVRWLNLAVRRLDGVFKTSLSQYGWAVTFVKPDGSEPERPLTQIPGFRNVCCSCGAGHPAGSLRPRGLPLFRKYACPSCEAANFFSTD